MDGKKQNGFFHVISYTKAVLQVVLPPLTYKNRLTDILIKPDLFN